MKAISKTIIFCLIATLLAGNLWAKDIKEDEFIKLAQRNYSLSLKHDNPGVRNSALLQVIKFQNRYSELEFDELVHVVKKMIKDEPVLIIRTNAHMALIILQNPQLSHLVNPVKHDDPNKYFDLFYLKLAESQLAME